MPSIFILMAVPFPLSANKNAARRETLVQRFIGAAALLVGPSLDRWRDPRAEPTGLSLTSGVPSRRRGNGAMKSMGRGRSPTLGAARMAAVRRIWGQTLRSYCAVRKNRQPAEFWGESGTRAYWV